MQEHPRQCQPDPLDAAPGTGPHLLTGDRLQTVAQSAADRAIGHERVDRLGDLLSGVAHQGYEEAVPAGDGRHRDPPQLEQPAKLLL